MGGRGSIWGYLEKENGGGKIASFPPLLFLEVGLWGGNELTWIEFFFSLFTFKYSWFEFMCSVDVKLSSFLSFIVIYVISFLSSLISQKYISDSTFLPFSYLL